FAAHAPTHLDTEICIDPTRLEPGSNTPSQAPARVPSLTLQPMVIASFLRLVTHPKVFSQPTPMAAALRFVDAILAAPGVERASVGPDGLQLRAPCDDKALAANDVPDAWLATAVLHQGEHVVSFDADFRQLLPGHRFTLSSHD